MRIDDNKPAQWWRDVCEIFERHGFRCSLAVNAALLSESQGACLRELAARGHEIMDHAPSHSIDSIVYPDQASFERASRLPFAHDADPAQRRVFFDGSSAATPEELVGKIEARIASGKSHVTLSHMQTRDIKGFLEKTERFAALLEERKVPVVTMGESIESRFGGDGRKR